MNKPSRWSYSSLSTYQECPSKWKYSYIDELPWPSSAAAARGTRLHSLAEGYLLGQAQQIPHELRYIGPLLEEMTRREAKPEAVWLLNRDWQPDPNNPWIKAIVDVHYFDDDGVLIIRDFKSGQAYDSHRNQLELYAVIGLKIYPEAPRCDYDAVYIDSGTTGNSGSIIRAMVEPLQEKWHSEAERMFEDEEYAPNPGRACKWCPYNWSKGGPCTAGVA